MDACLERQCGAGAEGIDCGTCPGATQQCDDQGACVDACAGRECGEPLPGIDCGTCAPPEQCGLAGNCFSPGGCPADTVEITGQGYCIDSHEATNARYRDFLEAHGNDCFVEAYSDPHAGSGLHAFECHAEYLNPDSLLGLSEGQWVVEAGFEDHPVSLVTIGGALLACEHWGGHLCKLEEWQGACHGPQGLAFPYGNEYDPLACNACDLPTGGMCGDWPGEPVAVGSYAGCEGGYPGLFDMSGNVYEWVDHCLWTENEYYPEILVCVQKGGSYSGLLKDLDCGDDGPDDYWWDLPYNWSERGGFRCCYYQD